MAIKNTPVKRKYIAVCGYDDEIVTGYAFSTFALAEKWIRAEQKVDVSYSDYEYKIYEVTTEYVSKRVLEMVKK